MLTETTIGGHFDLVNSTLEEIVVTISDGEFDPTFLSRYQHGDQLKECCVLAVDRLAADPFAGRVTCAHLIPPMVLVILRGGRFPRCVKLIRR